MSDKLIIESNNLKYALSSIDVSMLLSDDIESLEKSLDIIKSKINTKKNIEESIVAELDLDKSNPKNIEILLSISKLASKFSNEIMDRKKGVNEAKNIIKKTFSSLELYKSEELDFLKTLDEVQSFNVKISLFESLKKLMEFFESDIFKNDGNRCSNIEDSVSHIIDISYSISKDWIAVSNKTEKEYLLSRLIPVVTDIYIDTFVNNVLNLTEVNYRTYNQDDFWTNHKQLESIIENMDMGYQNSDDINLAWLKKRIYKSISDYVDIFSSNSHFLKNKKLDQFKGLVFEKMANISIDSWIESGNSYLDKCNGMTEEEFEKWAQNEGQKPMPYDNFLTKLEEKVSENSGLIHDGSIDLEIINKEIKEKVSLIWGMSDAIFKMSKVNEI